MSDDPSREELLAMLSGQGYSGGAKKKIPKGLKSWISFRKKHPNMTIKQQSRAYAAKKGKGIDEEGDMEGGAESEYDMEGGRRRRRTKKKGTRKRRGRGMDEDFEGGADPSSIPTGSDAWMTKNLKKTNAMLVLGKKIYDMSKRSFPVEYKKAKKEALGFGVSFQDYVRFAKDPKNAGDSGSALRVKWDKLFPDGLVGNWDDAKALVEVYYTPKEVAFIAAGFNAAQSLLTKGVIEAIENS